VRFTSLAAELGVLLDSELKFGEAYMDGTFVAYEGSISEVIGLAMAHGGEGEVPHLSEAAMAGAAHLELRQQFGHGGAASLEEFAHHYDLGGRFYSLFPGRRSRTHLAQQDGGRRIPIYMEII
jgi:cyclopropane-fatty-acyl-phospholipid synthase